MGLFDAIDVSASGLTAERLRMDVVSENLANAQTTRGPNGGPYQRKTVVLQQAEGGFAGALAGAVQRADGAARGVQVAAIVPDTSPNRRVHDPGHPDADAEGYVTMPNVFLPIEMVNLMTASRAYEANLKVLQNLRQQLEQTLMLLRNQ